MPSSKLFPSNVPAGAVYAVQICRVDNGWIAQHLAQIDQGSGFAVTYATVHADPDGHSGILQEQSLAGCLRESFDDQRRSKHRGGLVITCPTEGYENDPTYHTEERYTFYDVTKPIDLPGVTIVPNGVATDNNSGVLTITLKELQDALNEYKRTSA